MMAATCWTGRNISICCMNPCHTGAAGEVVREYIDATVPLMSFGEYWDTCEYTDGVLNYNQDAHRQRTVNWCDKTGGTAAAFDFTTKGKHHSAKRSATSNPPCCMLTMLISLSPCLPPLARLLHHPMLDAYDYRMTSKNEAVHVYTYLGHYSVMPSGMSLGQAAEQGKSAGLMSPIMW